MRRLSYDLCEVAIDILHSRSSDIGKTYMDVHEVQTHEFTACPVTVESILAGRTSGHRQRRPRPPSWLSVRLQCH
jgi:hypothetical protein